MRLKFKLPAYFIVFLFALFVTSKVNAANAAPYLQFSETQKTVQSGQNITVSVNINTGTVETISADVYLLFDPAYFDVVQVNPGTFFPKVFNNVISPGTLYVGTPPTGTSTTKSGAGLLATVDLRPKQNGSTQIRFDCRGNDVANTSKININPSSPQNVIDCSATNQSVLNITISSNAGASTGTTTTASPNTVSPSTGTIAQTTTPQTYTPPTVLPQTGAFEDTIRYTLLGSTILVFGFVLKKYFPV